jgi:hypothetical protein
LIQKQRFVALNLMIWKKRKENTVPENELNQCPFNNFQTCKGSVCALYWEDEEFISRCSIAQLASDLNDFNKSFESFKKLS